MVDHFVFQNLREFHFLWEILLRAYTIIQCGQILTSAL